jgi:hypothetical protein
MLHCIPQNFGCVHQPVLQFWPLKEIIADNKTLAKKYNHKDIYMSDTKDVKGWVPFTLYDFFGYLFRV